MEIVVDSQIGEKQQYIGAKEAQFDDWSQLRPMNVMTYLIFQNKEEKFEGKNMHSIKSK